MITLIMNYNQFKNSVQYMPLVFSKDVLLDQESKQVIRNQLNRWHVKKMLIKLKRGIFILNQNDRKINPSRTYIANQLYSPSYVSLEYALNYYNLIPERVSNLTSISTKKTLNIENALGSFIYQHIKPVAYRGFKIINDESGLAFFIAEPEKAVVDFCYLNMGKFKKPYEDIFKESYRFQNIQTLKSSNVLKFSRLFNSDKLMQVSGALCRFIEREKKK